MNKQRPEGRCHADANCTAIASSNLPALPYAGGPAVSAVATPAGGLLGLFALTALHRAADPSAAHLVALPVRSLRGGWAWVSCPAALDQLAQAGLACPELPAAPAPGSALAAADCPCLIDGRELLLEEFHFPRADGPDVVPLAQWLTEYLLPAGPHFAATRERFPKQFVLLSDGDFTHFARFANDQDCWPAETLCFTAVSGGPPEAILSSGGGYWASRWSKGGGR